MVQHGAIIGGEESGGLTIKGHIPEKDGVLADLLITEMVAMTGKAPTQILREIYNEVGAVVSTRVDIHLEEPKKSELMNSLRNQPPVEFAGRKVNEVITIDGVKLMLEGSAWVLIRPSGTEPLIRCYMEASDASGLAELEAAIRARVE
jgi:phosphomannomutase